MQTPEAHVFFCSIFGSDINYTGAYPGRRMLIMNAMGPHYDGWNAVLHEYLLDVTASILETNVFAFSIHQLVQDMIEDPRTFGLANEESMWLDYPHIQEAHHVVAMELSETLLSRSYFRDNRFIKV
jgi:hypothetical protein